MTPKSDIVLFPGSFNPFTIGHKSIVDRCLAFAGQVIIGIGYNPAKMSPEDVTARVREIQRIFADVPEVEVRAYRGLTVNFAKSCAATYMVRGVRSVADFEYERNLADANYDISGIETLLMPALPRYSFVSSSMVRELRNHGIDVSPYLP